MVLGGASFLCCFGPSSTGTRQNCARVEAEGGRVIADRARMEEVKEKVTKQLGVGSLKP